MKRAPVTPAQKLAGLIGVLMLLFGGLGFAENVDFGAGSSLDLSGRFLGIAVNGWTNLAHVLLGLALLSGVPSRVLTRINWRNTALVYLVAVLYGFIDGRDVFELFPLNTGGHIFDCAMLVIAVAGARTAKESRSALERDTLILAPATGASLVGPGTGSVGGPRRFLARIDSQI